MYRTLLAGVSKEFVLIGCVLRKKSVFILYFTHTHLFNENELRTHTLQARCGTFTLLPWPWERSSPRNITHREGSLLQIAAF